MIATTAIPLNVLRKESEGVISHFSDDVLASKMIALGILPGSRVRVVQKAPLNGGMYVKVNELKVALRINEAAKIFVNSIG